ncbi:MULTISPECIES: MFS transporter [Methylobacterium]|jgi:hypothetical protein|uniref:MFS transporter n=2 Tax=Methylobacterium TaxID=407 RepID=A0A2R4WMA4_9HYPH|nr:MULTISPECIES: MFS transporter [Methylobacterium]MBZ6414541.1 MFS transporter [Methylobacterium sp.]AWB22668.1 MFS transporter [Methylobacterium currus]MBK3401085.1 MFS transporter [Methylobacterium ajmalii]MBK3411289.1 MFS transporter [Methylobacterium ajmalii]MBK3422810.1 MFS transporter [Methylobacterium ajmalii]
MTERLHAPVSRADAIATQTPPDGLALLRWFVSAAAMGVLQAAAPVAFSLVALGLTGDASGGAAIVLAMTLAQVVGAVPVARLGTAMRAAAFLRILVGIRTLALGCMAVLVSREVALPWLVACAAVSGSVNGAAYGYLRSTLNRLTPEARLPRALGIAATLNEVTFVLAPVLASVVGTVSPAFAVATIAVLGAVPALLVPSAGEACAGDAPETGGSVVSAPMLLWLLCATAGGAAVAAIEIGAVALALSFGHEPAMAILFTVPLCLASVAGGVWVSVRNLKASRTSVLAQLSVMTVGSLLAALDASLALTVAGAVLMGFVLAPLGTYYSLVFDALAPAHRRAEAFALLRTANSVGIILASAVLTVASLPVTLAAVAGMMLAVTSLVGFTHRRARSEPRPATAD